jgi:hypothetical protein
MYKYLYVVDGHQPAPAHFTDRIKLEIGMKSTKPLHQPHHFLYSNDVCK